MPLEKRSDNREPIMLLCLFVWLFGHIADGYSLSYKPITCRIIWIFVLKQVNNRPQAAPDTPHPPKYALSALSHREKSSK